MKSAGTRKLLARSCMHLHTGGTRVPRQPEPASLALTDAKSGSTQHRTWGDAGEQAGIQNERAVSGKQTMMVTGEHAR